MMNFNNIAENDGLLCALFAKLFNSDHTVMIPDLAIESGTFRGTGTTAALVKAIVINRLSTPVYTIEASEVNYRIAKENLAQHPFVTCIHGMSLDVDKCLKFLEDDDFILNHPSHLHVDSSEPLNFYAQEIEGQLFGEGQKGENNVFDRLFLEIDDDTVPLIMLDSAGGIGLLEFQTVVSELSDVNFYLWLDDINHIKHYRSAKIIEERPDVWRVMHKTDRWLLAFHKAE